MTGSPHGIFEPGKLIRGLLAVLIIAGSMSSALCQEFILRRIELADQKVIIHYDLLDTVKGRTYTIVIYTSNDNFINPLQKLSGDVGLETKPGTDRKIIWDARTELGENYAGSISLEIRGRLYIPFVRFSGFEEYKVLKRGKPYQLTWSGGTQQNVLNFDLLRGDQKITTFANIANVGNTKITIPGDVKPGKDYRLRISDSKNKDEVVYTGTFEVRRRTPLALKAVPLLAVGFLAVGVGGATSTSGPAAIPDPITPK